MPIGPAPTPTPAARLALRAARRALPHIWLAPILLYGLWLRIAGLGATHLYGDEAEYAIVARHLSQHPFELRYPPLIGHEGSNFVSQPPLALYAMAFTMRMLGPTDVAAILPSVVTGLATIVVVYLLGLRLGGRGVAAMAALLVSALHFHVDLSRRAMLDAPYVLFLVATAWLLVAWIQERDLAKLVSSETRARRADYYAIAAGLAATAAALSKLPGALAVIMVALTGAAVVLRARVATHGLKRALGFEPTREELRIGRLLLAPAIVGALGYILLVTLNDGLSSLTDKLLWQADRLASGGSGSGNADRSWTYYLTDPRESFGALLGTGVVVAAVAGLAFQIHAIIRDRARRLDMAIVPLFVLLLLGFFMFSSRKQGFYLLPFAPFSAVLVAVLAHRMARVLRAFMERRAPERARTVGAFAIILVMLPTAYPAASLSFTDFSHGEGTKPFGEGVREAALYIEERDPDAAQYGTLLGRFSLLWYNEQTTYHRYADHGLVEAAIDDGRLRFIVADTYLDDPKGQAYIANLVERGGGEPVATFGRDSRPVIVYEMRPLGER